MRHILFFTLLLILFGSIAASRGVALIQRADRTGSPITQGSCANCHVGGDFNPNLQIQLLNDRTELVNHYLPGEIYTIRLSTSTENKPEGYGWQSVVMDSSANSVGTLSEASNGGNLITLNGNRYFEHGSPRVDSVAVVTWQAPDFDLGEVTIYGSANTVNRNGSPDGDQATQSKLVLNEVNADLSRQDRYRQIKLFPTLIDHELNIINAGQSSIKSLHIYNLNGKIVYTKNNIVSSERIYLSELKTGMYFASLSLENNFRITQRIIKR